MHSDIFPKCIDYLALGHLHVPQKVNGSETMRYSGSPIPMGFGEANQEKSVCLIAFEGISASIELVSVPVFQKLERIRGNWDDIQARIIEITATTNQAWLEIIYEGDEIMGDLSERLEEAVVGTEIEILRVKNHRIIDRILNRIHDDETLDDLNVHDVFQRCLSSHNIPEQQRVELLRAYQEVLKTHHEEDILAE
ncbi:MAG: exonuclease SbcCD subunit D C-terminal domain-containing protein [Legionellales bacterium]